MQAANISVPRNGSNTDPEYVMLTTRTGRGQAMGSIQILNPVAQVVTGVFVDNAFRCAEKQRSLVAWQDGMTY